MKRLQADVAYELARVGGATPAGGMARIVDVWPHAVGPTIARNAWPARIARDGTLHVATSSSAWAFELAQLEPHIVRRLRATAGAAAPRGARFAVGRLPEPGQEEMLAPPRPPEPGAAERAQAARLAAEIDDEELRYLVAKAAAYSLAGRGSGHPF